VPSSELRRPQGTPVPAQDRGLAQRPAGVRVSEHEIVVGSRHHLRNPKKPTWQGLRRYRDMCRRRKDRYLMLTPKVSQLTALTAHPIKRKRT
jgi:hypothetical protein